MYPSVGYAAQDHFVWHIQIDYQRQRRTALPIEINVEAKLRSRDAERGLLQMRIDHFSLKQRAGKPIQDPMLEFAQADQLKTI